MSLPLVRSAVRADAYGRARSTFLMDHLELARATLEPSNPIPASGVELTQVQIRMLLA